MIGLASAWIKRRNRGSDLIVSAVRNARSANKYRREEDMIDATIDSRRLLFPGLVRLYQALSPYAYDFMRFSAGAVLVPHGFYKLFLGTAPGTAQAIAQQGWPMPLGLAYLQGFIEFAVAICLSVGLFTRAAALIIWLDMSVIITVFNWQYGYFWTNRGIEYALLWWLLCIAIFFRGGGPLSVDRLLGKEI
jgi:putative oxidoreductase